HGQLLGDAESSRIPHLEEVLFVESPGHARCVHDDADTGETDARSDDVVSVGPESVEDDPPGEAASDEDSAVGGKDPPEVLEGLEGGDEPVQAESDHAGHDEHEALLLAHSLPYEPGTANLGDGSEDEQANRGAVETDSEHPLARAIVTAARERGDVPSASSFRAISGRGVEADVDGS